MLEILGIVLLGLVLGVVAVVLVGVLRIRRMRSTHRARLARLEPVHSSAAALFGLASDGARQARGVGTLAASDRQVVFVQLVPDREVVVERGHITSVQRSRQFMGSTASRDLVVITWETNGVGDAVALTTDDLEVWLDLLSHDDGTPSV